jgi:hypothetical protein
MAKKKKKSSDRAKKWKDRIDSQKRSTTTDTDDNKDNNNNEEEQDDTANIIESTTISADDGEQTETAPDGDDARNEEEKEEVPPAATTEDEEEKVESDLPKETNEEEQVPVASETEGSVDGEVQATTTAAAPDEGANEEDHPVADTTATAAGGEEQQKELERLVQAELIEQTMMAEEQEAEQEAAEIAKVLEEELQFSPDVKMPDDKEMLAQEEALAKAQDEQRRVEEFEKAIDDEHDYEMVVKEQVAKDIQDDEKAQLNEMDEQKEEEEYKASGAVEVPSFEVSSAIPEETVVDSFSAEQPTAPMLDTVEEDLARQQLEQMAREQGEEQAWVAHEQEPIRQEQEAVARQHAQEEAHVQADLELVRQDSERQARWLAEESARMEAEHDLEVEKEKEKGPHENPVPNVAEESAHMEANHDLQVEKGKYGEDGDNDGANETSNENDRNPGTEPNEPELEPQCETEASDATQRKGVATGPKLVVLMSKAQYNVQQRANQDRALTWLKGKFSDEDINEVDGSDQSNKDLRNVLFGISGIRAQYPQFFLKTNENDTSFLFLGGYDWIEFMNESGQLSKEAILGNGNEAVKAIAAPPGQVIDTTSVSHTPSGPKLIVLLSKSPGNLQQRTNQDRALMLLKGKFQAEDMEQVDGSDLSNKDRRNELFDISGLRGNYPQFFLKKRDGNVTYLGDFDWIEDSNESGLLSKEAIFAAGDTKEAKKEAAQIPDMDPPSPPIQLAGASDNTVETAEKEEVAKREAPKKDATGSSKTHAPVITVTPSRESPDGAKSPPRSPAAPTVIRGKRMVLLISNFGGGVKQKGNQLRAKSILQSSNENIVPEYVDAADPMRKEVREKLWALSGVQGNYPQIFVLDISSGKYTYVGGIEALEQHYKKGALKSIFEDGFDKANAVAPTSSTSGSNEQEAMAVTDRSPHETVRREMSASKDDKTDPVDDEQPTEPSGIGIHIAIAILGVALGIWMITSRRH